MLQFTKYWEATKTFVKRFWMVFVGLFAVVFGAGFFLGKKRDHQKEEGSSVEQKDAALDKVVSITKESEQAREKNQKTHEEVVKKVEDQYVQQKKTLDEEKKKEVEKLAKDYSDNPEELAKKLSELTGFKVVLPED